MAAADGKDAASGAVGAVVCEVAAQAFLAEKLKTGISQDDLPALEERGVNLAKLAAGMAAAVAGADVDTAAQTGDNGTDTEDWPTNPELKRETIEAMKSIRFFPATAK